MPSNVVKTEADERAWKKAKAQASAEGQGANYAYIMVIFKKMRKGIMDYSDIVKAHKYKKRTGLQIKLIKGFQSHTDMPKVGDKVKNTNPGCVHYKSEGVVTGIKDVPGGKGKTISYRCTNDGSKWKRGDTLDKTPDQLSPMKKHIDCGKCLGARRG